MFETLPDMAAKRAELTPDGLAFRDLASGRDWTFRDVDHAANGIADRLVLAGLVAGQRVAILCHNRAEFFATLFACQKAGLILCPLNWRQPAPELQSVLEAVDARAIISDATHAETAREAAAAIGAKVFGIERDLSAWMSEGGISKRTMVSASAPWYLLFTSGTTGRPKAVVQTARMAWASAVNASQATGLTSDDRSVNFLPLFHTAGINLYTLPVFLSGGHSTILPKFDPDAIFDLIRSGQVTQFFGVPAIYQAFSLRDEIDEIDWSGIRCGCGGAPLAEPLVAFFAERGAFVQNGYGMTETGPCALLMDPENVTAKIGSAGKAQSLTEIRLNGVADGLVGEGEIELRGPGVTPGYFENVAATKATFTDDGWLATGDVARRDEDGYYFIVDRIKDMYISGGENVYPAEVERVLDQHPAILEAAVIGVPDEKWGEVGAAFLMLRPGAGLDIETIRPWCRERLAGYKVPASVHLVEDFPRTAAGKIQKPVLRARWQDA